jgi:hypothetical protein
VKCSYVIAERPRLVADFERVVYLNSCANGNKYNWKYGTTRCYDTMRKIKDGLQ